MRLSAAARCSPVAGSDLLVDDQRLGTQLIPPYYTAAYVGEKKVLSFVSMVTDDFGDFEKWNMNGMWPTPALGSWELRDAWVISVRRLPQYSADYCYGQRVMHSRNGYWAPLWEEMYDNGASSGK